MNRPKPMFIVVEGLDGSGKSTLAGHLAKRLGAHKMATPDGLLSETRRAMESHCRESLLARKLFYASTVVAASNKVAKLLDAGKSVVMDRYWLSTMVYHAALGEILPLEEVAATLQRADVTIFLDVATDIRRQRLHRRGELQTHDRLTLVDATVTKLQDLYGQWARHPVCGRLVHIQKAAGIEELVDLVIRQIDPVSTEKKSPSDSPPEPISFKGIPRRIAKKAKAILAGLASGKKWHEYKGRRLNRNRAFIRVPVGKRWRLILRATSKGLIPVICLSHEAYNHWRPA